MRTLGVATLSALVIAGCGGDSDQRAQRNAPIQTADSPAAQKERAPQGSQQQGIAAEEKAPRQHEGDQDESRASVRQKALEQIPEEQRINFSNTAALGVLRSLGFPHPEISTDEGGQIVTVTLPTDQVCAAGPTPIRQAAAKLREVILYVRAIKIEVESEFGVEPALRYTRHCPRPKLPRVKAPVAFSMSGTGLREGRDFRIKSRRWTLVYQAKTAALDLFVVKGETVLKRAVKRPGAGVGRLRYKGPGRFRIVASSPGRWRVRAHDGT